MTFPFPLMMKSEVGGVLPNPTITYATTTSSTGIGASSFNYTGQSIGTAGATRRVIAYVGVIASGAATQVTGVTIGGVTAALASDSGLGQNSASIWIASVPTGTTATVAVTTSTNVLGAMVSLWPSYDLVSATPTDTASATGTATLHTLSLDLSANGVAVAGRVSSTAASRTHSWSGATERVETTINANGYGSSADYAAVGAESPHALTVTLSGTSILSASVSASFR